MRSYVYAERIGLDHLRPMERPDPVPGPHDVVLRMRAAALNFRDLAIARGHYHIQVSPPLVPLSDGAGEVVAVGGKVTRFRLGDLACPLYFPDWIDGPVGARVARRRLGGPTDGVLSEMMCLNEEEAVRAPKHLDAAEAATLPVAPLTAWNSLYQIGTVRPGESVVVQGTGGVSTAALQFARAGGARTIAVVRGTRHEARLRQLGVCDVLTDGDAPDWPKRVLALVGGADVSVNVAGGDTLTRSISRHGRAARFIWSATPPTRRRVSISSKRSAAPPPCISQRPAAAPRSRPWCGRWSFTPSDRRFPATFRSSRLPRHSSACSRVVTSARS